MRKDIRICIAMLAYLVFSVGCSTMQASNDVNDIVGKYELDNGSMLQIKKGESANEYRISAVDIGEYIWTSVGFFSSGCRCIESVFQYDSHQGDYGDAIGIHRFSFLENNSKVVKLGGWKELNEFAEQVYVRQ